MRQGFPVTETGFELALKPQATLEFLISFGPAFPQYWYYRPVRLTHETF